MIKTIILGLLVLTSTCFAQNEKKVAYLQTMLKKYQHESQEYEVHMKKLVAGLQKSDIILETKIAATLNFIKKYKDSDNSHNRIIRNKEWVINGLKKSIGNYSDRRRDMTNEIKFGTRYSKQDMQKIRAWFDAKITLRVKQITEMTKSLESYKEYYDHGDYNHSHLNEKRRVERAAKEKLKVVKDMRRGITKLSASAKKKERELSNIHTRLSTEEINKALRTVYSKIEMLENSIQDIISGGKEGKKVGSKASSVIGSELRRKVSTIKTESKLFFRRFDSAVRMLNKRKSLDILIEKYEFTARADREKLSGLFIND